MKYNSYNKTQLNLVFKRYSLDKYLVQFYIKNTYLLTKAYFSLVQLIISLISF